MLWEILILFGSKQLLLLQKALSILKATNPVLAFAFLALKNVSS